MKKLYISNADYQQHSKVIHSIADQYHLKESFVREIYEDELHKLLQTAKFNRYLSVLTTKHVKEIIYKSGMLLTG